MTKMNKLYVEKRQHLNTITKALNYAAKPRQWVLDELSKSLKTIKDIKNYYRHGMSEEQNGWDCGRQDSFGDMVDQAFDNFTALKLAYKIQRNEATSLTKLFHNMVGINN